jgi:hypothetical protein
MIVDEKERKKGDEWQDKEKKGVVALEQTDGEEKEGDREEKRTSENSFKFKAIEVRKT